ncbi:hypothetical protein EYF80_025272 [Liparis tanakae]|uniref:Uncharacterized protein n=1 Tax=Liparis tanakae TaxID=230148 RepID=A0A4Z2HHZ1_9TELE|nr:hypothetical protein EYF80_025272 [Liparis tanakae]
MEMEEEEDEEEEEEEEEEERPECGVSTERIVRPPYTRRAAAARIDAFQTADADAPPTSPKPRASLDLLGPSFTHGLRQSSIVLRNSYGTTS